ncbi:MAG: bifunctional diaminohydroxyphosphoribosylaminopyrimidine deaminase/5-amino-6-(5-phosphoribosylamino)uracil reductase RibD [Kiloniellales bacterium]
MDGDPSFARTDLEHMQAALTLARRGLGRVAPNPAVGCVIVRDGRVVGRGWTQPGGRPHAETEALAAAENHAPGAAKGATAYVSFEPCAHHGKTPPCCEALIAAGIARCVVAIEDPDPRVAGRGLAALREAGIDVTLGPLAEQASLLNAGFLMRLAEGRPLVTLKLATSLDGRIATRSGESRWITGPLARSRGHLLRAQHDAVLIGSNTAMADNPRLDVRLPGLEDRAPLRIVLDGHLRLPLTHDLVARAGERPTCLITLHDNDPARLAAYSDLGLEVIEVPPDEDGRPDLTAALQALGKRGLTRLLVEGGGHVAAGLLRAGLVDRLAWFRAPRAIGGDGIAGIGGLGLERLAEAPVFRRLSVTTTGEDLVETYQRLP